MDANYHVHSYIMYCYDNGVSRETGNLIFPANDSIGNRDISIIVIFSMGTAIVKCGKSKDLGQQLVCMIRYEQQSFQLDDSFLKENQHSIYNNVIAIASISIDDSVIGRIQIVS